MNKLITILFTASLLACAATKLPQGKGGSTSGTETDTGSGGNPGTTGTGGGAGSGSAGSSGGTSATGGGVTGGAATGGSTATPDFAVTLVPASLSIAQGFSGSTTIHLVPTGAFAGEVLIVVGTLPVGITADAEPLAAGTTSGSLTLHAGPGAVLGSVSVNVTATAGALSHAMALSLTVTAPTAIPNISSVTLSPNSDGSHQIPQGHGRFAATVTGTNFTGITAARMTFPSSSGVTLAATDPIFQQTATHIDFFIEVAHGAELGDHLLVLANDEGVSPGSLAVTVTPLSVAQNGNDLVHTGSTASPFHTLQQALSIASSGDTISLAARTDGHNYGFDQGEALAAFVVPAGVAIIGNDSILQGQLSQAGLQIHGAGVSISHLSIEGFGQAIYFGVPSSSLDLNRVSLSGNTVGIDVESARDGTTITAKDSVVHCAAGATCVQTASDADISGLALFPTAGGTGLALNDGSSTIGKLKIEPQGGGSTGILLNNGAGLILSEVVTLTVSDHQSVGVKDQRSGDSLPILTLNRMTLNDGTADVSYDGPYSSADECTKTGTPGTSSILWRILGSGEITFVRPK